MKEINEKIQQGRPKRIHIELYWKWTGKLQHAEYGSYDPIRMLNGGYRRVTNRIKQMILTDPLWRDERIENGNKLLTRVRFIYR